MIEPRYSLSEDMRVVVVSTGEPLSLRSIVDLLNTLNELEAVRKERDEVREERIALLTEQRDRWRRQALAEEETEGVEASDG